MGTEAMRWGQRDRLMMWDRDTGPSPAHVSMLRGQHPAPAARQQHQEWVQTGLVSPFSPTTSSLALCCQTQTGLDLNQRVQKSLIKRLKPQHHLLRAGDHGASALKMQP